jgi:hypothetical protein
VTEAHELDGVRLAIEIKPTYRAVGRAIWNPSGTSAPLRSYPSEVPVRSGRCRAGATNVDYDEHGKWVENATAVRRLVRRSTGSDFVKPKPTPRI